MERAKQEETALCKHVFATAHILGTEMGSGNTEQQHIFYLGMRAWKGRSEGRVATECLLLDPSYVLCIST